MCRVAYAVRTVHDWAKVVVVAKRGLTRVDSHADSDTEVPFTFATGVRTDLEPYVQAAVHYAAHELEHLRLNDQAAQVQHQQFLGYVERYLKAQQPKGGQQVKLGRAYFSEVRSRRGSDGADATPYPWR